MLSRAFASWGRFLGGRGTSTCPNLEPNEDGGTSQEERRHWGRIPCDFQTTCQPAGLSLSLPGVSAESLVAQVRNVSRGGINLRLPRAFPPGTLLSVVLPLGNENQTEVLACVIRCEPLNEDPQQGGAEEYWEHGCTFAAGLADEDLQAFGARREKPNVPDQRQWVRYPCHAQAAYQVVRTPAPGCLEEESPPEIRPVTVLNLSASGIAFQTEEVLRVGELLSLELKRDDAIVLTTLASVVRIGTAPDGARIVGCNFIHELAENQVQALL